MSYHNSIRNLVPETCPQIDEVLNILDSFIEDDFHYEADGPKIHRARADMEIIRQANTTLRGLLVNALEIIARQDLILSKIKPDVLEAIGEV